MATLGRTYISLILLSTVCLATGVYLAVSNSVNDSLNNSPVILVAGACLIGFGLATLYMGINSYLHHRAVILHITRRQGTHGHKRIKKKRSLHTQS